MKPPLPGEEAFDRIARIAAALFRCPIALVSFVEKERQWFKSRIGLNIDETDRDGSFSSWAISSDGVDGVMVIPDATEDPRFAANALVTMESGIRFYAAAPLLSPRGYAIGAISVADTVPRPRGLTAIEIATLRDLAAIVTAEVEARLAAHDAQEVHDLLQTTVASMGDGMISTDAAGRVARMNPIAEQLTGWTEAEATDKPIQDVFVIVNETTRQPVENPVIQALAENRTIGLADRTILLTRDGRELPIDDSVAPIRRNGSTIGAVLIFRDVSSRRQAERAFEYSENQFRSTFSKAPLGLVLTHLDGRFIESNEAYRNLTGYTESELSTINFISLTHAGEVDNNRSLFQRLVNEEIPSYVLEKRIVDKHGSLRWVRAHAALLHDADGKATKVIGLVEDVTSHKSAEQRFRFLAESIPQMVWTATPDGMLDYVNEQGTRYFDTPLAALLGAGWLDRVHPDDRARAVQRWGESLRSGTPYETEFRLQRGSDSAWRVHLARALPLVGDDGAVTQWFGTCTDIEDRNRAAWQIEADRARWRDLLLQTPAAIAVLRGPEHTIEWVNLNYELLVGRASQLLVGRPLLEALPEVGSQVYAALLDDVFQKGSPLRGTEALVRLGPDPAALQNYYVNFVYLPTRNADGAIDGIFVHITDVTATVTARKAVEESESQYRSLAETIPHLTWMADETGHIFWYNQRWYSYTGTTFEEMEGWGWEKVHDPGILPEVVANWRAALSSGQPFEMIFPLRSASGEFRPFLTRVEPIKDAAGKVCRWFGTNTDITDQRKTEEQLRRINRDLEEFSYVASHDLQEPLRMVKIYSELLLREKDGERARLEIFAAFVSDGVRRMDTLIQDLLSFSRSVHSDELAGGTADLSVALHDALGSLQSRIDENSATIVAGFLPAARGDTRQMSHVFQNLISNALKYRNASATPEIHIAAERGEHTWTISVRDNGIGFDPQYSTYVFGLFKRLHNTDYSGTGLGLAICKRIVERYGGRMWAESVPGEGSTFYFTLPVAAGLHVPNPST